MRKRIIAPVALGIAAVFALASCGNTGNTDTKTTSTIGNTTSAKKEDKFTVTFDTNGGSTVASQQVDKNGKVTRPADPTKDGFTFNGWCKDAAGENVFDFDADVITANTTIYASWIDASSAATATFYWNYDGADVYKTVSFKSGGRISNPATPTREGYTFDGWYTTTSFETKYAVTTKYQGNQSFYAKWLKSFTMEAEDTQLTGLEYSLALQGVVTQTGDKKGSNFSGNVSGKNLIRDDEFASGGKFVWGCLNLEEAYLDFEFTSDSADDNAMLYITVSSEFWGFELTPDMFKVLVNPEDNEDDSVDYDTIDLTFVPTSTDSTKNPTWIKAYINRVSIKEGSNLIRLYVNNSNANTVGTIKAQGPIVDCITVATTSELVMTKYENN